jgi:N-acetylglucosaminyl-diphospho-decaprenol L-rhamnosyltransferase
MDLSVIIVNYKARELLLECLAALVPDVAPLASEIVVVDNDPGDGAPQAVAARFPAVRVIANAENVGYGRAANQGIRATSGEFVLVMNPDCEPRPGAVRTLIDFLRAHPRAAIAGPALLRPDGAIEHSARGFPDHFTFLFNRYSLLTRLFPHNRHSRRYLLSDWDHRSEREVDWLSGAFLMVRRAAIDRVGGFDEAFFMFNEDVDWCRRMKLAGWVNVFVPGAQVVHHVGASRNRVAPRVIVERHRGMIHYFHKHHPTNPIVRGLADALIMARAGLMLVGNAFKPGPR